MPESSASSYFIKIPIEIYGKEKLQTLYDAIRGNTKAFNDLSVEMKSFARSIQNETGKVGDMDKALKRMATGATDASQSYRQLAFALSALGSHMKNNMTDAEKWQQTIGRIGGRIGGAEFLGGLGVPGGGFIGSQLMYGLPFTPGQALGIGSVVTGLAAIVGMIQSVAEQGKYFQQQRNLATTTGLSVESTQMYSRVGEVTDLNAVGVFPAFRRMTTELTQLGQGSDKVKDALHNLGLDVGFAFQSPEKQLSRLISALKEIPDETDRARKATALIGDSAKQILPLVDTIDELTAKVKGTGVIFDREMVDRIIKVRRETMLLNLEWQNFWNRMRVGAVEFVMALGETGRVQPPGAPYGITPPSGSFGAAAPGAADAFAGGQVSKLDENIKRRVKIREDLKGAIQYLSDVVESREAREGAKRLMQIEELERKNTLPVEAARLRLSTIDRRIEDARAAYLSKSPIRVPVEELSGGPISPSGTGIAYTNLLTDPVKLAYLSRLQQMRVGIEEQIKNEQRQLRAREDLIRLNAKPIEAATEASERYQRVADLAGILGEKNPLVIESRKRYLPGMMAHAQDQAAKESRTIAFNIAEHIRKEILGLKGEYARGAADEALKLPAEVSRRVLREADMETSGTLMSRSAQAALQSAKAGGWSRYAMPSMVVQRREAEEDLAGIRRESIPQIEALTARIGQLQGSLAYLSGKSGKEVENERERVESDLKRHMGELEAKEIEVKTKSIDVINRFNESVDNAAEGLRSSFSQGFASMIISAQHGGRGALGGIRGFFEGQEQKILSNIGGMAWDRFKDRIPGVKDRDSTIGKILEGTWFGARDVKMNANVVVLNTNSVLGVGGGTAGGTTGGALDKLSSIIPTGTFSKQGIAQLAGDLQPGMLGGSGTVPTYTTEDGSQIPYSAPTSGGGSNWKASTMRGIAGGGMALTGALQLSKGGARNTLAGLGSIAGSAATLLPMISTALTAAGPIGAAIGMGLGIAAALMPDPRKKRAERIESSMFENQYMAPEAWNMTMGTNGGYSDLGMFGGVRSSNFSAYPTVANSYLDVPRRTVVPGRIVSPFGGYQNVTGAMTSPPVYNVTINALDSKSFLDRSADIVDAFHEGIRRDYHPVINEMGQQLGLRS